MQDFKGMPVTDEYKSIAQSFQKMLHSLPQKHSSKLLPHGYQNTETHAITCTVWWKCFSWPSPIKNVYLVFKYVCSFYSQQKEREPAEHNPSAPKTDRWGG